MQSKIYAEQEHKHGELCLGNDVAMVRHTTQWNMTTDYSYVFEIIWPQNNVLKTRTCRIGTTLPMSDEMWEAFRCIDCHLYVFYV